MIYLIILLKYLLILVAIIVAISIVPLIIIFIIWLICTFTDSSAIYSFLLSHQEELVNQYFTTLNADKSNFYSDGLFTIVINDFLKSNNFNMNPWFAQDWSVHNLYVNPSAHTISLSLHNDGGPGWHSNILTWNIPQADWKYLLK